MKREVVQDFLNVPGILGVALMDGRSRPFFWGVDQTLNFQQKEALAQGIQQVVETTPPDFEFFEFQFTGHQVYIYKLDHGIILLVLTSGDLLYPTYVRAVERLKIELQDDFANAIATFRLLAGNFTLSEQSYMKPPRADSGAATLREPVVQPPSSHPTSPSDSRNGRKPPTPSASPAPSPAAPTPAPAPKPPAAPSPTPQPAPKPAPTPTPQPVASAAKPATPPTAKELVEFFNEISQFTKQYLGNMVVGNYWKSTRPKVEWLEQFEVDRSGKFLLSNPTLALQQPLTPEQQEWVQQWLKAFVKRCAIVIRDFPALIQQMDLDERFKALL